MILMVAGCDHTTVRPAAGGAYLSTRFLLRYFVTRTLTPFAIYSVAMGVFGIAAFA